LLLHQPPVSGGRRSPDSKNFLKIKLDGLTQKTLGPPVNPGLPRVGNNSRRHLRYWTSARIGAANKGVDVGWSAPASFSSVTATASAFAIVPRWMCIAPPSAADWNMPAAFALPSLTIHIS